MGTFSIIYITSQAHTSGFCALHIFISIEKYIVHWEKLKDHSRGKVQGG